MERRRTLLRTVSDDSEKDCQKRCSSRARKRVWYFDNGEAELNEENDYYGLNTWSAHCPTNKSLPVTCGNKEGNLDVERLGNGEACIECEGRWFSPTAFEDFGGKASNKKWKTSIYYMSKPLHFWFEQGSITTKGFRRRKIEHKKHRKIPLSNNDSESSSEERAEVENGGEVVDSEDETVGNEENKKGDEDPPSAYYLTNDLEAFKKHALQMNAKVIIRRLPVMSYEPQTTCEEPSFVDTPLDGDVESVEEWRPRRDAAPSQVSESPPAHGGGEDSSGSTQSSEGGGGEQRQVKPEGGYPSVSQSETAASSLEFKLEYAIETENAASDNHSPPLNMHPLPLNSLTEDSGVWQKTATGHCDHEDDDRPAAPVQDIKEEEIEATCSTGSSSSTMVLVECKYESALAITDVHISSHNTEQSQEREVQTHFSQTVKPNMPGVSAGASALDTMDLDQLKKEKAKMQLRVLKLQEEYYTLKLQQLKQ